jgi:hypothetical protein
MPIDPIKEKTFPVKECPGRIAYQNKGRRVHVSTVWRWITRGLRGVKLETVKIGGTTCTSEEALRRFFAALSAGRQQPATRSNAERQAQVERELQQFKL